MNFKLHSDYKPTGDQPEAIRELVQGFREGNQAESLLAGRFQKFFKWRTSGEAALSARSEERKAFRV